VQLENRSIKVNRRKDFASSPGCYFRFS